MISWYPSPFRKTICNRRRGLKVTLRIWSLEEEIELLKTNSGAAVTTWTSCPELMICFTTCSYESNLILQIQRKTKKLPQLTENGNKFTHMGEGGVIKNRVLQRKERTSLLYLCYTSGMTKAMASDIVCKDQWISLIRHG